MRSMIAKKTKEKEHEEPVQSGTSCDTVQTLPYDAGLAASSYIASVKSEDLGEESMHLLKNAVLGPDGKYHDFAHVYPDSQPEASPTKSPCLEQQDVKHEQGIEGTLAEKDPYFVGEPLEVKMETVSGESEEKTKQQPPEVDSGLVGEGTKPEERDAHNEEVASAVKGPSFQEHATSHEEPLKNEESQAVEGKEAEGQAVKVEEQKEKEEQKEVEEQKEGFKPKEVQEIFDTSSAAKTETPKSTTKTETMEAKNKKRKVEAQGAGSDGEVEFVSATPAVIPTPEVIAFLEKQDPEKSVEQILASARSYIEKADQQTPKVPVPTRVEQFKSRNSEQGKDAKKGKGKGRGRGRGRGRGKGRGKGLVRKQSGEPTADAEAEPAVAPKRRAAKPKAKAKATAKGKAKAKAKANVKKAESKERKEDEKDDEKEEEDPQDEQDKRDEQHEQGKDDGIAEKPDEERPRKRPRGGEPATFARRPCPATSPANFRWLAIKAIYRNKVVKQIQDMGEAISKWEERGWHSC